MTDETTRVLFEDVCTVLQGLQSELSRITTINGSDPTAHIAHDIDELCYKIATLTATAHPQVTGPAQSDEPNPKRTIQPNPKRNPS